MVSHTMKRMLLVAVAGLLLLPAAASAAPPPIGVLTELPGTNACISADGSSEAGASETPASSDAGSRAPRASR